MMSESSAGKQQRQIRLQKLQQLHRDRARRKTGTQFRELSHPKLPAKTINAIVFQTTTFGIQPQTPQL